MDSYFLHITNRQYGLGIFQSIDLLGNHVPPPPSDSGYRVTTNGFTRTLTISDIDYRITTAF